MRADLLRFKEALTVGHPGISTHESAAEFDAFFESLVEEVRVPRSAVDFHMLVMRLTARLRDGHTRAFPTNATQRLIYSRVLPFHVTVQHERIFVRRDLSEANIRAGSEILAIDKVPSNRILRRIERHIGVDGGILSAHQFRLGSNYNSFSWIFPLLFGFGDRYEVAVRDAQTRGIREVTLKTINFGELARIERERYGALLHVQHLDEERARPPLELRIQQPGYAVLRIRRFFKEGFDEPVDSYPALYRDAFRQIANANVSTLIIDLRANGGGIGANSAHLVRYLSDSTFVPTKTMTFRGNDAYYAGITTDSLQLDEYFGLRRVDEGYAVSRTDRIIELQSFTPVRENGFRGRLIVLIDGGTVSAAGMAAGLLRQYTNAVFVGQETGGYAGMSNGLRQLTVRGLHTDSAINFPLAHSEFGVNPHLRHRGVVPDHVVFETVDDISRGRDAVFEFALSLLH